MLNYTCKCKYNSANEVHKFILSLNQRPRKILNYLSPIEYLDRKII
ncbi:hypothetical protein [Spiroplasma endosymbiont of Lasioglossum malachurum]